ncbi:MAG TPA: hypothetical protein DCX92_12615, partial [Bacteroidetes bacterium]|nr:hypothetical protein [Bacteroidota bacterium]
RTKCLPAYAGDKEHMPAFGVGVEVCEKILHIQNPLPTPYHPKPVLLNLIYENILLNLTSQILIIFRGKI